MHSPHSRPDPRRGRVAGPLVLLVPLLAAAIAASYLVQPETGGGGGSVSSEVERVDRVAGFFGRVGLDDGTELAVELAPWCARPERRALYDAGLRQRLGRPDGGAWRLDLRLLAKDDAPAEGAAWTFARPRVEDARGDVLTTLAPEEERPEAIPGGAVGTLFGTSVVRLEGSGSTRVLLFGEAPRGSAAVVLTTTDGSALRVPLEADDVEAVFGEAAHVVAATSEDTEGRRVTDAGDGEAPEDDELTALRERVAGLERELRDERASRTERELEWYDFNRALGELGIDQPRGVEPFPVDESKLPEDVLPEPEPEPDPKELARIERTSEIQLALRTLLKREGVHGMDLLEVGELQTGSTGPVLFRLLDDRGRLSGHLYADRLRLEASRAARVLTIVLEDGYESHSGQRVPFADGRRRIALPFVDPAPWFDEVPELFLAGDLLPPDDDGLWRLEELRERVNVLLADDTSLGWYRLKALGGVLGDELMDVHLEAFTSAGRIERHLFADRMRIRPEPPGVRFELRDGASMRGDTKTAFLNGRHQVFLPRAELEAWRRAGVPGLSPPPGAPGVPETEGEVEDEGAGGEPTDDGG